jgi:hypothetical protein
MGICGAAGGGAGKGSVGGVLTLAAGPEVGLLRFTGDSSGGRSTLAGTVSTTGLGGWGSSGFPQDWQNKFLAGFTVWQYGHEIVCASMFRAPLIQSLKEICLKMGCDMLTLHQRIKKSN